MQIYDNIHLMNEDSPKRILLVGAIIYINRTLLLENFDEMAGD